MQNLNLFRWLPNVGIWMQICWFHCTSIIRYMCQLRLWHMKVAIM